MTAIGQKLNYLFSIAVLAATLVVVYSLAGTSFITNLGRLNSGHPYVSVSHWDVPFFVGSPAILIGITIIGLRLAGRDHELRIQRLLNIVVVLALVAIATRLIYGFAASFYLTAEGYSSCWHLSSPSLMSPTVWVKQQEYCIPNTGMVRDDLLRWMDAHAQPGQPLPFEDLEAHAADLLSDWETEQREKYRYLNR